MALFKIKATVTSEFNDTINAATAKAAEEQVRIKYKNQEYANKKTGEHISKLETTEE